MNNQTYILNPAYYLRSDRKRVLIYKKDTDPIVRDDVSDFLAYVHPLYAILFSLFDGKRSLTAVMDEFSQLTGLNNLTVSNILQPLLENKEDLAIQYDSHHLNFPKNVLVKRNNYMQPPVKTYDPNEFIIPKNELDLDSWRLYTPLELIMMINTTCVTDCVYCYADRRKKTDCKIPIGRVKELIAEAKELNMRSFDLTGGELFRYKYWEELLKALADTDFIPYISTKVPIDLETIKKIKNMGITKIQVSIDSVVKEELMKILRVDENYYHKLIETIENLDKNGFTIFTNTQVTRFNQHNIEKLIDYLLQLKNIRKINLGAAGFSLYKSENQFFDYRADVEHLKRIEEHVQLRQVTLGRSVELTFGGYSLESDYFPGDWKKKEESFKKRSRCSANFSAFVVLPDGRATICEELYWHPEFIIGDLMTQSIEEVWNSTKARALYKMAREAVSKESACRGCKQFSHCHEHKGVCWKEVLYAYGNKNWDYPDPKCPQAPRATRSFFLDKSYH